MNFAAAAAVPAEMTAPVLIVSALEERLPPTASVPPLTVVAPL